MRETVASPAWDSQEYFDESIPPYWDFTGGEVHAILATVPLVVVGHDVGSPKWVLALTPLAWPGLGSG